MRKLISNQFRPSGWAAFLVLCICLGCTPSKKVKKPLDIRKEFVKKDFNLLPFRKTQYGDIQFRFPKWFVRSYNTDMAYKDKALCLEISPLALFFSVEELTAADYYSSLFDDLELSDTNAVLNFHDAYIERRINSLQGNAVVSETEKVPGNQLPARVAYVSSDNTPESTVYAIAALEARDKVYIFQFICTREMMGYVADDFQRILRTVKLK